MMKPKICFVSMPIYPLLENSESSRFCGGAELHQLLIGSELAARGYPISYVTLDHGQGPECQLGPFRVLGAYRPGAGLPMLKFYYPRWGGIMKALQRANADVYYMRGAGFLLGPIVMYARRNGKRVVFAGASDTDFDPKARHFRFARDRFLYWWGLRRTDAVVTQNQHQAACAKKLLGVKTQVIHNALPTHAKELSKQEDVLWVGNIRPKKMPERFVDLAAAFPEHSFVMVGGIADESRYPEGPSTTSGLPAHSLPNCKYTGYLAPAEVEDRYARARVLVNTSDVEGFPNTFLHAWSWGVPVITYVDPDSIVEKNRLGWVVSSPDEMSTVLARVLDGTLQASPERIAAFFRAECMTEHQVDRYESVFAEFSGP